MKLKIFLTCVLTVMTICFSLKAQSCGSCSTTISGTNNLSYTVGVGHIFCLDSSARYTGTITLSGGTVCNRGVFKPGLMSFTSGQLQNYGSIALSGTVSIGTNQTLSCGKKSFLSVNGGLTVSGGTLNNQGIANVKNTVTFSSGTFSNSGIVNCSLLSGSTSSIVNTGIINHD